MVMTAQGSAIPDAGGLGGQVTQTFIPAPRVQVDHSEVEIAESRGARIGSARRSKTSRKRRTARAPSPDDPSGKSSPNDDDDARWNPKKGDDPEEPKRSISKSEPLGLVERSAPPPKEGDARDANGTLKLTQDMLTRMELRQDQMSLNAERAFTAIQSLAQRAIVQEERLARSVEAQKNPKPEFTALSREGSRSAPPAEEAARAELERRWEQRQAEVEEEKKAWETDIERTLNVQLAAFQQKIRDLEDARNRDQATIRILRKVPETRSRNLPATSSQVQGAEGSPLPDPATQESVRATLHPQSGNAIKGHAGGRRDRMGMDSETDKLRAALRGVTEVKYVKEEPVARSREVTSGAVEPKGARATFQQAETKPSASDTKGDGRMSVPKKPRKERSRRSSRKDKDFSGPDSDQESSDSSSNSSDSDSDASLRNAPTNYATMKTSPAGLQ
ncbi:hypothetical protein F442_22216 [Phytophthora nicotianae P10297]|uniref:Uncharacterized protein n=1 Tax=Phytophthora nicotianae P10297 TaxID=1317064 RepID=W2Y053_PHYNI|nr:hypothetical protein F442_22216 [Phytophthora nicotianae P10297]